jgi:glutathione S-transferase
MRLYHIPYTRSTRVLWLLEEIGQPYELTVMKREDRQTDEHRRRHPLGHVPVLEDDEGFLFESAALCLHLADQNPDAQLNWPPATHERALVYQWTLFAMTELEPAIIEALRHREDDPERLQAGVERVQAAAAIVEQALDGHDYLVGDRFSVADIVCWDGCGAVLKFVKSAGLIYQLPNIEAYIEQLEARSAHRRAIAIGIPPRWIRGLHRLRRWRPRWATRRSPSI